MMGYVNLCKGYMTKELKYVEAEYIKLEDLELVAFGTEQTSFNVRLMHTAA